MSCVFYTKREPQSTASKKIAAVHFTTIHCTLRTKLSPLGIWKDKVYYYTSDSLWKIWLVESIQSIHNSLWTWHDKCNICCRYCIYHVKSNVCLVTKPLECSPQKQNGWTLRFCFWGWIKCEKCIIKPLLNSVCAWYHESLKPPVCVICLSLRLRQITQTSVLIIHDMLNLIQ